MITEAQMASYRASMRSSAAGWFANYQHVDACTITKVAMYEVAAVLAERTSKESAVAAIDDVSFSLLAQTPVRDFRDITRPAAIKRHAPPSRADYVNVGMMFLGGAMFGAGTIGLLQKLWAWIFL